MNNMLTVHKQQQSRTNEPSMDAVQNANYRFACSDSAHKTARKPSQTHQYQQTGNVGFANFRFPACRNTYTLIAISQYTSAATNANKLVLRLDLHHRPEYRCPNWCRTCSGRTSTSLRLITARDNYGSIAHKWTQWCRRKPQSSQTNTRNTNKTYISTTTNS